MEIPRIKQNYAKYYKCSKCDYTCSSLWNLKSHTADNHISIKEKLKLQYYCRLCDSTSISETYYKRHLDSDTHKTKLIDKNIKTYIDEKINEKINERIDERIDEKINEKMEEKMDEKMDEKMEERMEERMDEKM
jgi:uncharacterized membrane protein YheB (UPF0754 family)